MILANIPTNVITGFLGAGKTTFIQALLQAKPEQETWAILVNEFGEIGIDASLMQASDSVVIREVAGGCLCCAAGIPLQVAVTQLLARAKPDRLIIEPTGLGHPQQIIKLLASEQFKNVLSLQSSCCVIDPRTLQDERYSTHETFLNQLYSSDIWLLSKADLWQTQLSRQQILASLPQRHDVTVFDWQQTQPLSAELLKAIQQPSTAVKRTKIVKPIVSSSVLQATAEPRFVFNKTTEQAVDMLFNEVGIIFKQQHAEGHYSYGWRFNLDWAFEFQPLLKWIESLNCERLKAVMITDEGVIAVNRLRQEMTLTELDDTMDSRLEIISQQLLDATELERVLTQCRWLESYS